MAYADYTFYKEKYMGKAIIEADFNRLATRADSYIDSITIGRASSYSADDAVKMAACAVADAWLTNEQGGDLQSQSVGSWSRSYAVKAKSAESRLYDAVSLYLSSTGLLSRWL